MGVQQVMSEARLLSVDNLLCLLVYALIIVEHNSAPGERYALALAA